MQFNLSTVADHQNTESYNSWLLICSANMEAKVWRQAETREERWRWRPSCERSGQRQMPIFGTVMQIERSSNLPPVYYPLPSPFKYFKQSSFNRHSIPLQSTFSPPFILLTSMFTGSLNIEGCPRLSSEYHVPSILPHYPT